jgi:hypothetical protein
MNKLAFYILLILLMAPSLASSSDDKSTKTMPDFRGIKWGSTFDPNNKHLTPCKVFYRDTEIPIDYEHFDQENMPGVVGERCYVRDDENLPADSNIKEIRYKYTDVKGPNDCRHIKEVNKDGTITNILKCEDNNFQFSEATIIYSKAADVQQVKDKLFRDYGNPVKGDRSDSSLEWQLPKINVSFTILTTVQDYKEVVNGAQVVYKWTAFKYDTTTVNLR